MIITIRENPKQHQGIINGYHANCTAPNILAQNYTGTQFNISAYVDNFSYYLTPENNYQFNYNVTVSNTPFCNMFTEFITSKTGEITGLLLSVNKTKELYQFNPPIKTTSQQ